MSSLKTDFEELLERIRGGRQLGHASFEPIYYLVFSPRQILEVKRAQPAWTARLRNDGWDVHCFSMATEIASVFTDAPMRRIWLEADSRAPLDWEKTNQALANALSGGALQSRFEDFLGGLEGDSKAIALVTDLEALHPYMRVGSIESRLYGKFKAPTVLLYPGERTGKSKLKFLGFYPEDGNYRSVHVGG